MDRDPLAGVLDQADGRLEVRAAAPGHTPDNDVSMAPVRSIHSRLVSHGARPPPHVLSGASAVGDDAADRGLINAFGNGVILPFLFIYLHNVRGIALGPVGLIVATNAVVSLVAGPLFGSMDRPRRRPK